MADKINVRYYKERCKNFINTVNEFCQIEQIPCNINNALMYKSNIGVGPFWKHLYKAPKMYLAHSKSFLNYRRTLDPDFANDILDDEEIFKFQNEALRDPDLYLELKKTMKHDFI